MKPVIILIGASIVFVSTLYPAGTKKENYISIELDLAVVRTSKIIDHELHKRTNIECIVIDNLPKSFFITHIQPMMEIIARDDDIENKKKLLQQQFMKIRTKDGFNTFIDVCNILDQLDIEVALQEARSFLWQNKLLKKNR